MTANELYAKVHNLTEEEYQEILPFLIREDNLNKQILADILDGASEEFKHSFVLLPIGVVPAPIRIPMWMFRKFPDDPDFELDDIERVAMAHVIHFTLQGLDSGYIECSGDIENVCKCTTSDAHNALMRLVDKGLITQHIVTPEQCMGHKRNFGYFVNMPYVRSVLLKYKVVDLYN